MMHRAAMLGLLALSACIATGQDADEPSPEAPPAETQPGTEPADGPADGPDPLPSLDELLGLSDGDSPEADDRSEAELEQTLEDGGTPSDAFIQAVELMRQSADRLEDGRDTGIVTQRIQEDILTHLEQLIRQAQQQQSSSSSSSSQSQDQAQQQPNQQNQQQQQQSEQQASGEPENASPPPPGEEAAPGSGSTNAASWGSLPERLRGALQQGSTGRYSSLYRAMTEAYYRRLAEEASE
ncbi:MAG: hypothetical protein AAGB48_10215 [Planctomycetota bacterium]